MFAWTYKHKMFIFTPALHIIKKFGPSPNTIIGKFLQRIILNDSNWLIWLITKTTLTQSPLKILPCWKLKFLKQTRSLFGTQLTRTAFFRKMINQHQKNSPENGALTAPEVKSQGVGRTKNVSYIKVEISYTDLDVINSLLCRLIGQSSFSCNAQWGEIA